MTTTDELTLFETYLRDKSQSYFPATSLLNQAINYGLLSNGKRIRPMLCLGSAQFFKGEIEVALCCGVAVEMIHAYSLIHDDLPAMDNDDLRRGKPTNHIVFGQAHAILAADALNTAAPAFLLKELNKLNVSAEIICKITTSLLDACGYEGMIKGQALDIEAERGLISAENKIDLLSEIHQKKTGELIRWSFLAGLYSTLRPEIINQYEARLSEIGKKYGLLYQIIDDILDETASLSDLGKTPGKDKKNGKLTYPQIFGIDQSKREARKIIMEVEQSLLELQYHSPLLQKMIYELKLFALN